MNIEYVPNIIKIHIRESILRTYGRILSYVIYQNQKIDKHSSLKKNSKRSKKIVSKDGAGYISPLYTLRNVHSLVIFSKFVVKRNFYRILSYIIYQNQKIDKHSSLKKSSKRSRKLFPKMVLVIFHLCAH